MRGGHSLVYLIRSRGGGISSPKIGLTDYFLLVMKKAHYVMVL